MVHTARLGAPYVHDVAAPVPCTRDTGAELTAFIRTEQPRLVGMLALYCGDRELAADLVQEALARACRDWGVVSGLESPGGWVRRVAINLANSAARRQKVHARAYESLVHGTAVAEENDDAGAIALRSALAKLPPRARMAVVLRYFDDLSVADTAKAMGCAEGTVKALTFEGINLLRRAGLGEVVADG